MGRQEQVDRLLRFVEAAAADALARRGAERELFLRGQRASARLAAQSRGLSASDASEWAATMDGWVRRAITILQRHGPLGDAL